MVRTTRLTLKSRRPGEHHALGRLADSRLKFGDTLTEPARVTSGVQVQNCPAKLTSPRFKKNEDVSQADSGNTSRILVTNLNRRRQVRSPTHQCHASGANDGGWRDATLPIADTTASDQCLALMTIRRLISQPPGSPLEAGYNVPLSQRLLTAAISLEVPRTQLKACPPLRRRKRCPEERGRRMCGHQVDHGYVSSAPRKSTATTKTEVTREA